MNELVVSPSEQPRHSREFLVCSDWWYGEGYGKIFVRLIFHSLRFVCCVILNVYNFRANPVKSFVLWEYIRCQNANECTVQQKKPTVLFYFHLFRYLHFFIDTQMSMIFYHKIILNYYHPAI